MSKNIKGCLSHNTDNWRTPSILYDFLVNKRGYIDLFPYCSQYDQYENKTYFCKKLFINPPYSHINTDKFLDYLYFLQYQLNDIYLLIPARTDTKAFQRIVNSMRCDYIFFIAGRLHFNDSKTCAPFPSVIIHINQTKYDIRRVLFCDLDDFIKRVDYV